MNTIEDKDNLPEWCQEKISLAEDYLVTVWDYLQSEKEQGVAEGAKVDRQAKHITTSMMKKGKSKKDAEAIAWAHIKHPKKKAEEDVSVKEVSNATLQSYKDKRSAQLATQEKPSRDDVSAFADRYKKSKGIKDAEKRLSKSEGWTHDSLADQLFEHERTYEEQLQNKLNKQLGK
jgi:tRNA 2-selenouridine synthase SelU